MGEFDEKLGAILGNQEAMGQIMALARSLGGGAGEAEGAGSPQAEPETPFQDAGADPLSMLGELDPRMLELGMRVLGEYRREDDKKTALLSALRPFLREERYGKLDRAVQIARLSRVIRVLFDAMGREGERDV